MFKCHIYNCVVNNHILTLISVHSRTMLSEFPLFSWFLPAVRMFLPATTNSRGISFHLWRRPPSAPTIFPAIIVFSVFFTLSTKGNVKYILYLYLAGSHLIPIAVHALNPHLCLVLTWVFPHLDTHCTVLPNIS